MSFAGRPHCRHLVREPKRIRRAVVAGCFVQLNCRAMGCKSLRNTGSAPAQNRLQEKQPLLLVVVDRQGHQPGNARDAPGRWFDPFTQLSFDSAAATEMHPRFLETDHSTCSFSRTSLPFKAASLTNSAARARARSDSPPSELACSRQAIRRISQVRLRLSVG